jgi:lysylphosphatidylglycerol synthetase-like protein (DUF2156 family)
MSALLSSLPEAPASAGGPGLGSDELETAAAILRRHATNPSAFLALNQGTERLRIDGVDGLVAYRRAGRHHLVQLGGPFAAEDDQDRFFDHFVALAADERRRIVGVQLQRHDAERYAAHGFTVNQFGASYARTLAGFDLGGKAYMRLRNKLSRARRSGLVVGEVGVDVPATAELEAQLADIDRTWLRAKGRHIKELQFLVGQRGGPAARWRRLFVAIGPGGGPPLGANGETPTSDTPAGERRVLAYVTFAPVGGTHPGWLHDLSRRRPGAPPGTMELIVATAISRLGEERAEFLHFGLTPFTGLDAAHELPGHSPMTTKVARFLGAHGKLVYPAAEQLAYKHKWSPDLIFPEYVAFQKGVSVGAIWSLLRVTNSV